MKHVRILLTLTLTLALLGLGSGVWLAERRTAAAFPAPAGLAADDGQAIQSQVAKLMPADRTEGDYFGWSVSVDGDTAVVGADYAVVDGQNGQGAAYVFYRDQGGANAWGQVAKLTAADGGAWNSFGVSVSVSGDTAVVGASNSDAAYVFYRDQGGADAWGQVAKLTPAGGGSWPSFGCSVAVSGDVAVVGAYRADVGDNADQGAAYVFYRNQGGTDAWGQVVELTAADGAAGDFLGWSSSVNADTAVVGAGINAAYVFYRNQGGADAWGQVAKLTPGEEWVWQFAFSVSVSGDVAVVGAPNSDVGNHSRQGAACVFSRNQGGADAWGQVATLTAADGAWGDEFGWSVSVSGDTAVVGAHYNDIQGTHNQGAAYAFYRDQGGADAWGQVAKLAADDGRWGNEFGLSVSLSGNTALVGAPCTDAAYVYGFTPPIADFAGSPTGGPAPLSVAFTNTSTGDYTTLLWDLGDGSTSSEANPSHIYADPGVYTVSLTASGIGGTNTLTREGYITAYTPVSAAFTAAPRSGLVPLGVQFTNTSTGDYTSSAWSFGDGATSTQNSPGHLYTTPGNYTVSLTVSGPGGTSTATSPNYIAVWAGKVHVDSITMSYVSQGGGRYAVIAGVIILDQNNQPVSGATVTARWTLPNGGGTYRQAVTDGSGRAQLVLQGMPAGVYSICVTDVAKVNWYYDSARNAETCDQKTVP
jgi:PKD repeat protein